MKLTNEDINKNHVDTIHQYYVLDYLKKQLNINEFEIYLYDKDTIKVIIDKNLETGYFKYNSCTKKMAKNPYKIKVPVFFGAIPISCYIFKRGKC